MDFKGEFIIILANLVWATVGIFIRQINDSMLPATQVFFRLCIISLILFIIFSPKGLGFLKVKKKELFLLFIAGFFGYGLMLLFFVLAIVNTTYANALTLLQFSAVILMVFGVIFLKEKLRLNSVLALLIALVGIMLIFQPKFGIIEPGVLYAIISAFLYAVYILIMRDLKEISIKTRLFYASIFGLVSMLPIIIIFERSSFVISKEIFFYQLIASILNLSGYALLNIGIRTVSATSAGILNITEPIFGLFIGYFFFKEMLGLNEVIGIILVISAVMVLNINGKKSES